MSPLLCNFCPLILPTIDELLSHLRSHSEDQAGTFKCQVCDEVCQDKASLEHHMVIHLIKITYQCHICDKTFTDKDRFEDHVQRHSAKNRPFKCPMCEKRYTSKRGLDYHILGHTGERPFSCNICPLAFKHNQALELHLARKHAANETDDRQQDQEQTCEKRYKCVFCTHPVAFFASKQALIHHTDRIHFRLFRCDQCTLAFKAAHELTQHRIAYHGIVESVSSSDRNVGNGQQIEQGSPQVINLSDAEIEVDQEPTSTYILSEGASTSSGTFQSRGSQEDNDVVIVEDDDGLLMEENVGEGVGKNPENFDEILALRSQIQNYRMKSMLTVDEMFQSVNMWVLDFGTVADRKMTPLGTEDQELFRELSRGNYTSDIVNSHLWTVLHCFLSCNDVFSLPKESHNVPQEEGLRLRPLPVIQPIHASSLEVVNVVDEDVEAVAVTPVKRGPGRPRGSPGRTSMRGRGGGLISHASSLEVVDVEDEEVEAVATTPVKRGPGKPRSSVVRKTLRGRGGGSIAHASFMEVVDVEDEDVETVAITFVKRGPGRPRGSFLRKILRGRSGGSIAHASSLDVVDVEDEDFKAVAVTPVKRGRGRPRGSLVRKTLRGRGGELKAHAPSLKIVDVEDEDFEAVAVTPVKRGRGRPRGSLGKKSLRGRQVGGRRGKPQGRSSRGDNDDDWRPNYNNRVMEDDVGRSSLRAKECVASGPRTLSGASDMDTGDPTDPWSDMGSDSEGEGGRITIQKDTAFRNRGQDGSCITENGGQALMDNLVKTEARSILDLPSEGQSSHMIEREQNILTARTVKDEHHISSNIEDFHGSGSAVLLSGNNQESMVILNDLESQIEVYDIKPMVSQPVGDTLTGSNELNDMPSTTSCVQARNNQEQRVDAPDSSTPSTSKNSENNDLVITIVSHGLLEPKDMQHIQGQSIKKRYETRDTETRKVSFSKSFVSDGTIKIVCKNRETVEWCKEIIPQLLPRDPTDRYRVYGPGDDPLIFSAHVSDLESAADPHIFLFTLRLANDDLPEDEIKLLGTEVLGSHEHGDGGITVRLQFHRNHLAYLREHDFNLNYGFGLLELKGPEVDSHRGSRSTPFTT